jgi:hypothetical protein
MPRTFTLKRRISFQEKDIDHIELIIELINDTKEICFARIFLKPKSITVSNKTAKAIAAAFPSKITGDLPCQGNHKSL